MPILEIRARRFFTSEEADVAPAVTILMTVDDVPNPDETIGRLAIALGKEMVGFPATDLREMTREEVAAYRATEADEE